jgi:hypothetical protein
MNKLATPRGPRQAKGLNAPPNVDITQILPNPWRRKLLTGLPPNGTEASVQVLPAGCQGNEELISASPVKATRAKPAGTGATGVTQATGGDDV